MKLRYQRGEATTLIIISLTLALVTALGWIFYQNFVYKAEPQKETDLVVVEKPTKTNKDNKAEDNKNTETYKGKRFTVLSGKYSIKLPNGWVLINHTGTDTYSNSHIGTGPGMGEGGAASLTYNENVAPALKKAALSGWGGPAEHMSVDIAQSDQDTKGLGDKVSSQTFSLNDGTAGVKDTYLFKANPNADFMATTDDLNTYIYIVKKGGSTLLVRLAVFSNNKAKYDLNLFDEVVKSIEIK